MKVLPSPSPSSTSPSSSETKARGFVCVGDYLSNRSAFVGTDKVMYNYIEKRYQNRALTESDTVHLCLCQGVSKGEAAACDIS